MLSAAQDILNKHKDDDPIVKNITDSKCIAEITTRICSPTSTGVVLLCNIVPGLCVKILCPFIMHRIPYWVRHTTVCVVQVSSLLLTAFSESVLVALCGVCLASFSSGLGETTYLGLAGHYSKHTIATWSSGTGMAGIVGAFSYAGLTDSRLLALLPAQAMLVMLVVPAIFMFTKSQENKLSSISLSSIDVTDGRKALYQRLFIVKLELTVFDCEHGFDISPASQYRWYQVQIFLRFINLLVLYQVGVFISRSSIKLVQLNMPLIALMPVLQLTNTVFFMVNAIYAFIPSFGIVCIIVLYEGLIGGGSYVNTFHHIHKKVFSSITDTRFLLRIRYYDS
ncbi:CLN3 protein [Dictyocaulus viviparus]|uniref:Battenin n=1 Tax=Dictyocaulus viviparus TaxID=29172 RepID=A0A0D8XK53_DICVI|nr:CLN3 protein [Dictyocaulus viviparus]